MSRTNCVLLLAMVCSFTAACTPRPLVRRIARAHPGCVYEMPVAEKVVALTIDDGPDARTTPRLMQVLREHNARATFFLISDRLAGNDSVVTRMLRDGHEIGNHTSTKESSINLTPGAFFLSFVRADEALRKFSPMRWVRPGSGRYNDRMLAVFRERRYQCVLGSVYPFDPQLPIAWWSAHVVRREVYPGAIIILHDGGYKGRNTEQVLRKILPDLTRRGYRVVTLSTLAAMSAAQSARP